ncbi:hypothetical protein [Aerosakkonema funiforme]|uniref:Uncharacterized protein n=1 Tax=Aerosakkonema funiforme FACHB-1375 TaxID=2949571 RepID=A0A926VFU9_9CYAN|nr:hypothetical protein [Aerosakkonema funiforme]MBD2183016.1 hypothetical protein [Aerosakkonema funiforme FACHB-1375]
MKNLTVVILLAVVSLLLPGCSTSEQNAPPSQETPKQATPSPSRTTRGSEPDNKESIGAPGSTTGGGTRMKKDEEQKKEEQGQ